MEESPPLLSGGSFYERCPLQRWIVTACVLSVNEKPQRKHEHTQPHQHYGARYAFKNGSILILIDPLHKPAKTKHKNACAGGGNRMDIQPCEQRKHLPYPSYPDSDADRIGNNCGGLYGQSLTSFRMRGTYCYHLRPTWDCFSISIAT
jgi:hypothetical protein